MICSDCRLNAWDHLCITLIVNVREARERSWMELANKVRDRTGLSRQAALDVLDRYTGKDKVHHVWTVRVGAHGAKLYTLLPSAQARSNDDEF
ncbi:hypothetical protein C380_02170 [Acidovorax sp. KKS102]|nr:hypothetical protein C380_02170 [Acidovorax sp. KKS102]